MIKVGSLRWMKENDPAAYRRRMNSYKQQYRRIHGPDLPQNSERSRERVARWRAENKDRYLAYVRIYQAAWRSKNKEKYNQRQSRRYFARRKPCRACETLMAASAGMMCKKCCMFLQWLTGKRGSPPRETQAQYIGTFTKEDVEKWHNVTTQRKATQLQRQSLKRLLTTLQSRISKKMEKPTGS